MDKLNEHNQNYQLLKGFNYNKTRELYTLVYMIRTDS